MSSFTTPLILEYLDGRRWRLREPFSYYTGVTPEDPTSETIIVPEGFLTDFASIPRALWVAMPPTGAYGKAAVIHDYLYRLGGLVPHAVTPDGTTYRRFSRAECDQIFRDAMKVLGVGRTLRTLMWMGVRAGGGKGFRGPQ
jgi:hypothetical protein